jgi:hypothetical protein
MKLNETLDVISYNAGSTSLDFILDATKGDSLAATEGKDLELKAGASTVGIWKGWTITGVVDYVSKSGDGSSVTYTRLTAARQLSNDTASAIAQLESNMQLVSQKTDDVMSQVSGYDANFEDLDEYFKVLAGTENVNETK